MTLRLKPAIQYDPSVGEEIFPLDYTGIYDADTNPGGYGAPNINASSVTATRMIWSSYLQEQAAEEVTDIVAGTEYLVGGTGNFTYDTKTYSAGDTFISMLDGTPTLSNCTLTETGRFSSSTDFLPTDVIGSALTPSLVGEDDSVFADGPRSIDYYIYTTQYSAGAGIPAGTYLVKNDTVTISGVTYRDNETFTAGGTFTFTGSGTIHLLYAQTQDDDGNNTPWYFQTSANAYQAIQAMELQLASSNCGCTSVLQATVEKCNSLYAALLANFDDELSLSISGSQTILNQIAELSENTCGC